jgi:hypothetical protein
MRDGQREGMSAMCSNCSGDDLRPESFTTFGVSSPVGEERFAGGTGKKRKRYRTAQLWPKFAKGALSLAILRADLRGCLSRIVTGGDRRSFVNLNLGKTLGDGASGAQILTKGSGLIEIRVSANSIIEVYANSAEANSSQNKADLTTRQYLSAWEESYAERIDMRRAMESFRRTRRLKYFLGYGAFFIFAALAVWCAVR